MSSFQLRVKISRPREKEKPAAGPATGLGV
jgi:hypothetical protein